MFSCDEDMKIRGVEEFLEELAAVAAWGGKGEGAGLAMNSEVGDKELLGVDVGGGARELEVDADEDPAVGA